MQAFSDSEDSELIAATLLGDTDAFNQLIARYDEMAQRVARRMLIAKPEIAREMVQEAWLQAFLSLERLSEPSSFRSWFYGIVLNLCRNQLRHHSPDSVSLDALAGGGFLDLPLSVSPEPDPQVLAEARELHQLVLNAVELLPPKIRIATLLFYFEQMSLQEIAALLGISVTAVKGRLHKSRLQLKQQLLPLYEEMGDSVAPMRPHSQRRKKMLKVTIADIAKQKSDEHHVVTLIDENGQRVLPIWIGKYEAEMIAVGIAEKLGKVSISRPMTFNFMAKLLEATHSKLQEVRIDALRDDTFFATAILQNGDKTEQVDCRPSDALALAVRTDSPILVAVDVLEKAGKEVPAGVTPPLIPNGYQDLVNSVEVLPLHGNSPEEREKWQLLHHQFLESLFSQREKPLSQSPD